MQNYVETLKVLNATWEVFDATDEVDDGDVQINEETEDKETKNRSQSNQITPIPKGTMARCVHALCSNYATWSIKPGSAGRPTFCDFHKDYWVSVKPI